MKAPDFANIASNTVCIMVEKDNSVVKIRLISQHLTFNENRPFIHYDKLFFPNMKFSIEILQKSKIRKNCSLFQFVHTYKTTHLLFVKFPYL